MNIGAQIWFGFLVMVLGMLIVFIGLIILIAAINLMSYVFKRRFGVKETEAAPEPAFAVAAAEVGLSVVPAAPVLEAEAAGELATVAALTAVVMAAADTGKKFAVRAIRRVDGSAWTRR